MRHFPQLETYTTGQYPLRRERSERIVRHESPDGRRRLYYDAPAQRVAWRLSYDGLTKTERGAVDALFAECEGRLRTFLFLDPAANLLLWSEDYSRQSWTRGPLLNLASGIEDPWGTQRAARISNSGGADQSLAQSIAAPGNLQYCCSAYLRGNGSACKLRIDSGGVIVETAISPRAEWERFSVSARPDTGAEVVTFSLILAPGSQADICGIQAEAQPAAGGYRRTTTRAGVYAAARFAEDELTWTQHAPNHYAADIWIESRTN